ncbi:hypothetical protein OA085_01365 [Alphaproteobacteria bacterium]|nr:hypothetical protein [Alphaproteobacteria bacterium]
MNNYKKDSPPKTDDISSNKNVDVQAQLFKELKEIVSKYSDYETPFIRSDGDIIITLKKAIKKKRQTTQSLSEAVKFMMDEAQAVRSKK